MSFQQREVQSPAPGEEQDQAPRAVHVYCLENSFAENDWGVLMKNKLNISQKYAHVAKKDKDILGCIRHLNRGDPSSLLSTIEAMPGILCPILDYPVKGKP